MYLKIMHLNRKEEEYDCGQIDIYECSRIFYKWDKDKNLIVDIEGDNGSNIGLRLCSNWPHLSAKEKAEGAVFEPSWHVYLQNEKGSTIESMIV